VWRTVLLGALVIGPVAVPILVGAANADRVSAEGQARLEFEVASVKPNASGDVKSAIQPQAGGRFTATNVTLRQLIRTAYQLEEFQISGGPGWLASDRFDIVAKAEGAGDHFQADRSGTPSRGQLMLRALLADRFKLEVHTGSRDLPIYALTLARTDGAFGPQVRRSARDCHAPGTASPTEAPPCGMRTFPGTIVAGGVTLAEFANTLSTLVGRAVHDGTGLTDRFEFTLRWTPDQIPQGFDRKASAIGLPPIDADGPSLFTAMREQLGLKLDSARGPIDILVIDHAERPSEN
jgi:uncharacterized protein (TIGR03435 family)